MPQPQRRSTSQRTTITHALALGGEFRSARELFFSLRSTGHTIGLATVYRALQDMVKGGEVDALRSESGELLYRRCASTIHHHHLVCRSCGSTREVNAPAVERWARAVADACGFVDIDHQVELFGLCGHCTATA